MATMEQITLPLVQANWIWMKALFLDFHRTKYENKHGWEAPSVTAG